VGEHWAKVGLWKFAQKSEKVLFLRRKAQWKAESPKLFTAKDAEEKQGLPLMNTDDTDFGEANGEDGRDRNTADGGWHTSMLKCTPFWDDLG
jgi:hypothetical protein